jgi:2-(1,2-epoxy-1,2-dihydrophenyl)acetyl-CoA isomerase
MTISSTSSLVQLEEASVGDGATALVVRMNRPEAMNALDVATKVALRDALQAAGADTAVRGVLLTAAGDRAFSVGQDLKEHTALLAENDGRATMATVREHYNPITRAIATMPKPVVAAVNGVAAGAGASLAFACDFRVLADTAGFNLAFAGIALSCDTGSSWTLPRLVGRAKALDLLYFPRTVTAAESLGLGLATTVVPAGDLVTEVQALTKRLAAGPTAAFGAIRRSVGFSQGHDLPASLELEAEMMALTGASEDHRNAVDSFIAKRKPVFEGR